MIAFLNQPEDTSFALAQNTSMRQVQLSVAEPAVLLPCGAGGHWASSDPLKIDVLGWPDRCLTAESKQSGRCRLEHLDEQPRAEDVLAKLGFVSPFVRFPPGLEPLPGTPSHGSLLHGRGTCQPCAWFWKSSGCKNGRFCGHCHLCPEGELKARKKTKATMMRLGLMTPKMGMNSSATASPPGSGFGLEPFLMSSESDTTVSGLSDHDLVASQSSEDDVPFAKVCSMPVESGDSSLRPTISILSAESTSQQPCQPSEGSALHSSGACQPCAWFWKASGCQNRAACSYCHLCPEGEIKVRRKLKLAALRSGMVSPASKASVESEFGM